MKEKSTIKLFKEVMIDMFKGYPDFAYVEPFKEKFADGRVYNIISILKQDGIIKEEGIIIPLEEINKLVEKPVKNPMGYRLTEKGINFAISMINLEYAEKMKILTAAIFVLGTLTFLLVLNQFLFPIFF